MTIPNSTSPAMRVTSVQSCQCVIGCPVGTRCPPESLGQQVRPFERKHREEQHADSDSHGISQHEFAPVALLDDCDPTVPRGQAPEEQQPCHCGPSQTVNPG